MELRGIGIIDIKDLFGVASTRDVKPIDLVVKLEKWVEGAEYDRLGISGETYELLGVAKPYVRLPVASGRNLALLVEIAARNHLMKLQGYDSAREFTRRIDEQIARQSSAGGENPAPETRTLPMRTRFAPDIIDRTRRQR
jgi:HPr kinase/phosphorylase